MGLIYKLFLLYITSEQTKSERWNYLYSLTMFKTEHSENGRNYK